MPYVSFGYQGGAPMFSVDEAVWGLNWAWGLVSGSTECQGLLSNKDHETGPLAKSVDLVRHVSCLTPSIKDYNYTCLQISLPRAGS